MSGRRAAVVPVIDEAACSLGRLAQASCTACAASCPHAALQLTDDGIFVDPAACTGCGACLAACPQRAVSLDGLEDIRPDPASGGPAVALTCPQIMPGQGPCLQALGLEALARLWLQGVRRIVTVTGDCAACPDGQGLKILTHVATLNALLAGRGLPPLGIEAADRAARSLPRLRPQVAPRRGRRALLGLGGGAPAREGPALARLQSRPGPAAALVAFAPRIDPARCTGCDACLRICPEAVLSLIKDESGAISYGAASERCSGCGLCMDVCGAEAVTIDRLALPAASPALTAFRCQRCGVEVHVPAAGPRAAGGLCPICARTNHHRRLFVVLP